MPSDQELAQAVRDTAVAFNEAVTEARRHGLTVMIRMPNEGHAVRNRHIEVDRICRLQVNEL